MEERVHIEPWGVYGRGPIRLEIPRGEGRLALKEYFDRLFCSRDSLFGSEYGRIENFSGGTRITFKLEELAEATFAYFSPPEFAKALETRLNPEAEQTEALVRQIKDFEKGREVAYMVREYTTAPGLGGVPAFYFHPSSYEKNLERLGKAVPHRFRMNTRYPEVDLHIPRIEKVIGDTVRGHFPVKFNQRNSPEELRLKLAALQGPFTLYFCRGFVETAVPDELALTYLSNAERHIWANEAGLC